jgi:hypothetical protein
MNEPIGLVRAVSHLRDQLQEAADGHVADSHPPPPPDLVLDIEVSRSVLKRMAIYAALGVGEVWRFRHGKLKTYLLQADGSYRLFEHIGVFPFLAMAELQRFIDLSATTEEGELTRQFMAWVETDLKPRLEVGRKNGKRGR